MVLSQVIYGAKYTCTPAAGDLLDHGNHASEWWLTQVDAVLVGAPLLRHVQVHVEEDHRVSEVLPGARVQNQHGVVGRGAGEGLLLPVGSVPSVQHLAEAPPPKFGAHGGVRQDGQDLVWVTWGGVVCYQVSNWLSVVPSKAADRLLYPLFKEFDFSNTSYNK